MLEHQIDSIEEVEVESLNNTEKNNSIQNQNQINNIIRKVTSIGTEEIFISLKKDIEITKKRNVFFHLKKESTKATNNNKNNYLENEAYNKNLIQPNKEKTNILTEEININDLQEFDLKDDKKVFEYSTLNLLDKTDQKKQQFNLYKNWKEYNKNFPLLYEINDPKKKGYEYIELNNMAFRLIKEVDYDEYGLELKLSFNLLGESQILIFTRSFVNKSINDSNLFDETCFNIDTGDIFNKYTSLIKIMKEKKTNRCNITFGTYYNDPLKNNKLCHKFFFKRQLIDYSEEKKDNINYDDVSEFQMIINDLGDEVIDARIYMNNNKKPNDMSGNFFIPINKKAKILIFGKGESVRLKEISGKIFNKRNEEIKNLIKFESENSAPKNCECCSII